MKIAKKSQLTGNINVMDVPVTQEQIDRWNGGELIQWAMPNLTSEQREFLMTGSTKEEWEEWEDEFQDEE
jgi:hypothetical protein